MGCLCRCFSLVDGLGFVLRSCTGFFDRVLLVEAGVGLMHNKRGLLRLCWSYGMEVLEIKRAPLENKTQVFAEDESIS
ncbi:hypothetical protein [Bartonella tribocorum]|uniref:hypothetical protein n=1 Tax=Bartonella tribocorum TaxID=85701 RepID=UPI0011AE917A|nr:hypothetical protein [Bartonella tribocorum]